MSGALWGGRFREEPDAGLLAFGASLPVDVRLALYDLRGSLAHVRMLGRQGIIPGEAARRIEAELRAMLAEARAKAGLDGAEAGGVPSAAGSATSSAGGADTGAPSATGGADPLPAPLPRAWSGDRLDPFGWGWRLADEDVHMAVERTLAERIGPDAGWLHTGRSRNDQVALDMHLYARDAALSLAAAADGLREAISALAAAAPDAPMPGYTHLQRAQPVTWGRHLGAYLAMFGRDVERFRECARRASVSPLGAGALAGSSFPLDREGVAAELGLKGVYENTMDAVSDRDYLVEIASACALCAVHMSRLAEELVLWSSAEFGFIRLSDAVATGSSMMPQKKNPDPAELVRGKTGRVLGDLQALLVMLKGLPLAYNKDMQEDKPAFFDAVDTTLDCLSALAVFLSGVTPRVDRMRAAVEADPGLHATRMAEDLVRQGVPFREAHARVGRALRDEPSREDPPRGDPAGDGPRPD